MYRTKDVYFLLGHRHGAWQVEHLHPSVPGPLGSLPGPKAWTNSSWS